MRVTNAIVVCCLLVSCSAREESISGRLPKSAYKSAEEELAGIIKSNKSQSYGIVPFEDKDSALRAKLAVPIRQFFVRKDELEIFNIMTDPKKLIHDAGAATFPVVDSGKMIFSVNFGRDSGVWEFSGLSGQALAEEGETYTELLVRRRDELAQKHRIPAEEFFEIRIFALGLAYLGFEKDGELYFAGVIEDPSAAKEAGDAKLAKEVFLDLVEDAKARDDNPG